MAKLKVSKSFASNIIFIILIAMTFFVAITIQDTVNILEISLKVRWIIIGTVFPTLMIAFAMVNKK